MRVTLRGPLDGRVGVSFKRRGGAGGSARRSLVIRGRKRIDFVFSGDARGLTQAIVRTTRGSRASKRIPRSRDDCAAPARGDVSSFGQDVFIRGPGSVTTNGGAVRCPNPRETIPVTVRVRVPSWAQLPAQVSYTIASGPCAPDASNARDLAITPGNAGDHKDAGGRSESTLQFSFDLSDGTGTGTVDPGVTAAWS